MLLFRSLLITIAIAVASFTPAWAIKPVPPARFSAPQVMIVLDASGSMRGKIQGQTKMAIARKVITQLVQKWDKRIKVGLIAYGHNRKGDCSDIETLHPVSTIKPHAIISTVHRLSPKGMTPLSAAVLKAAREMKFSENRAAVILVSDGKETCGMDPCALGTKLAAEGIDFKAYVVGFNVRRDQQRGLRCLAHNTGGEFYEANNANELSAALNRAVKRINTAPPAPVFTPLSLSAVLAPDNQPLTRGLFWRVTPVKPSIEGHYPVLHATSKAHPTLNLDPGAYRVEVSYGKTRTAQVIHIKKQGNNHNVIVIKAGYLSLNARISTSDQLLKRHLWWKVSHQQAAFDGSRKSVAVSSKAAPLFKLAPGQYHVNVKYGQSSATTNLTLKTGEHVKKTLLLNTAYLKLSAVPAPNGKVLTRNMTWSIKSGKVDFDGNRAHITFTSKATPILKLASGDYLILARFGRARAQKKLSLKTGEKRHVTFNMNAGIVILKAVDATEKHSIKKRLYWKIMTPKQDNLQPQTIIASSSKHSPKFILSAGQYQLVLTRGKQKTQKLITVRPGQRDQYTLELRGD